MKQWQRFPTFKQRGEWVELQFMAQAALHGYHVLKPWGDSLTYDAGIETVGRLVRVQVKSSSFQRGTGYYCEFKPRNYRKGYSLKQVDLFAAYVIPTNAWYLIPAAALLRYAIQGLMLCPVKPPQRCPYTYEKYREAWGLLGKDRRELARRGRC
ncbi:MAG: group I intron-associated PD-(D/E)XK endonuclease [Candidatus Sulfotelmatobacter sp.]